MSHAATSASRFLGCDVGKTTIAVFDDATGRSLAIANEPGALVGLRRRARGDLSGRL
jgi:hypothetical protein